MHKKSEPLTRITFSSEPLKPIEQIEFSFEVDIEPVKRSTSCPFGECKYFPEMTFEAPVKDYPALDIYKQEVKLLRGRYRRRRRRQ